MDEIEELFREKEDKKGRKKMTGNLEEEYNNSWTNGLNPLTQWVSRKKKRFISLSSLLADKVA